MDKNNSFTLQGTFVWGICAIFFLYEFLLRTVVGTFQHPIMYDLELSTFQFSILSSTVYLLIYAIMQLPVGFIVDRLGLKKSLFIGCSICAVSAFGFAYAYHYNAAIFFRFLTGLGSSFGFICMLISVYDWMPRRHLALLIGVSQFIGTMGPMLAAGPLEMMAESGQTDWRSVFLALGVAGMGLSVVIALFVKNNQEKAGRFVVLKRPESIVKTLKRLVTRAQPWYIACFSALAYFSIEYLSENEGKSYLVLKGFSSTFAAYMITVAWLGFALGCPLLGFLSDYFKRRRPLLITGAVSCTLAISLIVFTAHPVLMVIGFFLLGVGASSQSIGFATMAEQFQKSYLAVGLSLNNMVIMVLASVNAPLLGGIIDYTKTGPTMQLDDYSTAFYVLVGLVSLSLVFPIFFIKETFCKSSVDFTYLSKK